MNIKNHVFLPSLTPQKSFSSLSVQIELCQEASIKLAKQVLATINQGFQLVTINILKVFR